MKFFSKVAVTFAVFLSSILPVKADITDGHFSTNQIFDVQYYWSGTTLNASNFIAPYDMNFQHPTVGSGQYFAFFNSTTNPGTYGLGLYNADGTQAQVVHDTGTLQAIGPDALFYIGSGFFGTVITTSAGYAYGSNGSFTSMDTSVTSTDASSYTWASTVPLSAGQTASSGTTPTYVAITGANVLQVTPTSTNSPSGEGATNVIDDNTGTKYLNFDRASAGFTIKLDQGRVLEKLTITTANDYSPRDPSKFSLFGSNDGRTWTTIVNTQSITLSDSRFTTSSEVTFTNTNAYVYYFITFDSTKALDLYPNMTNCMAAYGGGWLGTENCNSVQVSEVKYYYDSSNTTTSADAGNGTVANPGTAGATSSLNTTPTIVSTAPGADSVSTTETPGSVVTTTNNVRGTTTSVVTYNDTRSGHDSKQLTVVRTTTTVSTTPITTVVTQTTPVTVTTVTTPTTVTTYSDGSTTTTNGTPVTTVTIRNDVVTSTTVTNEVVTMSDDQNYYTRIDQFDVLDQSNRFLNLLSSDSLLNRHSLIDGQFKIGAAIDTEKSLSFYTLGDNSDYTTDGYTVTSKRYGFGIDKRMRTDWIIGFNISRADLSMSGNDASGSLGKDMASVYSYNLFNDWMIKNEVGVSSNRYSTSHALTELGYSNRASASGSDYWYAVRAFAPGYQGLRPFVGARVEHNTRSAAVDSGSAMTAMEYAAVSTTRQTSEYGVRFDRPVKQANLYAEISNNSDSVMIGRAGLRFNLSPNSSLSVGTTHLKKDNLSSNYVNVMFKVVF